MSDPNLSSPSRQPWFEAGNAAVRRGDPATGATCCRPAVHLDPRCPQALFNLALVSKSMGKAEAALTGFRQVLAQHPDNSQAHFHIADLYRTAGDMKAAVHHYREAVRLNPNLPPARNNLGNALKHMGELSAAIQAFTELVRLCPSLAQGRYNLGSALMAAGRLEAATVQLREAVRLNPDDAKAWNNLGLCCKGVGHYAEAIACFSRALRLAPELAEARWNRAVVYLLGGDFTRGWPDFEARHDLPQRRLFYPFRWSTPRWNGEPLPSGTLRVHDEQGLGDTLQFVRYLPWVKQRCARVELETQAPLAELLRDLPGVDAVTVRPAAAPVADATDAHIALMSLPRIFGTDIGTIPSVVPYIWPAIEKRRRWAERLQGPGLRAGLVWAGRPEHHNDRNRSSRLQSFIPLLRIPGVRFYSLQKGPAAVQIRDLGLHDTIEDLDAELQDFTDTAAAVACLDLVICVDTAVAHLAGAMARPVWLLLPFIPDWRWMLNRAESPWYPTMRLFRQQQAGDWDPVFRQVAAALRERLGGTRSSRYRGFRTDLKNGPSATAGVRRCASR